MNPRPNALFYLAGAFLLLSPLSVATGLPFHEEAKYARLLATAAIWAGGMLYYQRARMGRAGRALMVFVVFFVASGLWSDLPHWAVFYKSLFALTCLAGVAVASSVRSPVEFETGLRFMGIVAGFTAVFVLLTYLTGGATTGRSDRLWLFGINPNMVGHTAAPLFILCVYLALNERSHFWRLAMFAACAALAIVVIGTGSRGAAAMAIFGSVLILVPMTARSGAALLVMLFLGVAAFVAFELIDFAGNNRLLSDLTRNNRQGIWSWGLKQFYRAPLLGTGWIHWGSRWGSVQNIYLQTLAECGLVGGGILLLSLLAIGSRWLSSHRTLRRYGLPVALSYLAAAFVGSVLLHGLAESATFMGSCLNALLLGMGVGLIDRLKEFGAWSWRRRQALNEARSQRAPLRRWRARLPATPPSRRCLQGSLLS